MWAWASADDELGYVYLPLSTPTGDWYGGHRHGDNLFAKSLVCLDAKTGERIWHFQAVHHGLWDYDFPTAPNLVDITVDGREVKAVAIVSKQAFTYVFDRVTGEPVWPIEERPVAAGNVPGEWYGRTQPIPTKPPAFDQQGAHEDDLIDFTPELRAQAQAIFDTYVSGPIFTPPSLIDDSPGGTKGTVQVPGIVGGAAGVGQASIQRPACCTCRRSRCRRSSASCVRSTRARTSTGSCRTSRTLTVPKGFPLFKPPYGSLVAIDLNAGEILWKVPNGSGLRDHPAIQHLNLPPLGQGGRVSPLVTKSLVYLGEGGKDGVVVLPPGGGGKYFRAYDKITGEVVWEMELPGGTTAAPMTYMSDGKQYIVVTLGWKGMPSEYVALALP